MLKNRIEILLSCLFLFLVLFSWRVAAADPLTSWQRRYVIPTNGQVDIPSFRGENEGEFRSSLLFGNGVFLARSTGTGSSVYRSSDGVNWGRFLSTAFAGGNSGALFRFYNGLFLFRAEIADWESADRYPASVSSTGIIYTNSLIPVSAVNGEVVHVSRDGRTSTNGFNWSEPLGFPVGSSGTFPAYGSGRFVKLGRFTSASWDVEFSIISSTDGTNWVFAREGIGFEVPYGILYGNRKFVVSFWGSGWADRGTVPQITSNLVSSDGINWSLQYGLNPDYFLNGLFITFPNARTMATSSDAVTWTYHNLPLGIQSPCEQLAFGNNTFVGVFPASNGAREIWQSDPITNSPPVQPSLGLQPYPGLTIAGTVGASYRIEYRDALNTNGAWNVLTNVVLPESPWLFFDRAGFSPIRRFYRAVAQ
jgi:hypothetical protein